MVTATVAIASGTKNLKQNGSPYRCEVGTPTQICAYTRQYSARGALVLALTRCAPPGWYCQHTELVLQLPSLRFPKQPLQTRHSRYMLKRQRSYTTMAHI